MKAIILAAGVGSRISKHIEGNHKCLLPIPNTTGEGSEKEIPLLHYTLHTLKKYRVTDISIVTGHRHRELEETISKFSGVTIHYNPFYELMNSIGSLWFAEQALRSADDDVLILNADTFLEDLIWEQLSERQPVQENPLLLVDSSRKDQADVKTHIQDNTLVAYGKQIDIECTAESTDIFWLPKSYVAQFHVQVQEMLEQKKFDTWWESAIVDYMHECAVQAHDLRGNFWSEIDFIEDYERICNFMSTH